MSKKQRKYFHFIEDIDNAVKKIERYTKNLNYKAFSRDEMVVDAVIRNFEVIREAMNNIPEKNLE